MIPLPQGIRLSEFDWVDVEKDGKTFIAVDGRGYETIARNDAEKLRYIIEVEGQVAYYREALTECSQDQQVTVKQKNND